MSALLAPLLNGCNCTDSGCVRVFNSRRIDCPARDVAPTQRPSGGDRAVGPSRHWDNKLEKNLPPAWFEGPTGNPVRKSRDCCRSQVIKSDHGYSSPALDESTRPAP